MSLIIVADTDPVVTGRCLEQVRSLASVAERVEAIVVAPPDARVPIAAERRSETTVVQLEEPRGLAAARNIGADTARGGRLAFLAVDVQPNERWLHGAISAFRSDSHAGAVASKVVDETGAIQFAGAAMTVAGYPVGLHAGEPTEAVEDRRGDVLFAAEAAMVVDAEVFHSVGGFDDELASGVEFADLGWRLWLQGFRTTYAPDSVVVGRAWEHDGPETDDAGRILGSLAMIYKNYDERHFDSTVAPAILRAKSSPAGVTAVRRLHEAMPRLKAARRRVQEHRVVGDATLLPLFGETPPNEDGAQLHDSEDVADLPSVISRHRIAIVTPDVLKAQMAGPAIRAWQMAIALSEQHDVRLATTTTCELQHANFSVSHADGEQLRDLEAWCDVLIFQGHVLGDYQWLRRSGKVLVVDIYDPFHLEALEATRDLTSFDRRIAVRDATTVINEQLLRGDYFLCASEKQRDFWLGQLAGVGRINPAVYDGNESLRSLISVVPFGASDEEPRHTRTTLKGNVPGIGSDDKVVLWGGGVYNWFDPLTLIRATDRLRHRIPEVRTYFMGMRHPNPRVPAMRMAYETKVLADELGLTGKFVFFNEGWVDYDDRQNYLLEADVGVSTHLDHIETAFSFRTRILDYLWASLPVVATRGDSFAELIELHGLGATVPPGDEVALEEALYVLLCDEEKNAASRAAVVNCVEEFRWRRTLEPLLDFCSAPQRAPDLVDPRQRALAGDPLFRAWRPSGWRQQMSRVVDHVRRHEYAVLSRKLKRRAARVLSPSGVGPGDLGEAERART